MGDPWVQPAVQRGRWGLPSWAPPCPESRPGLTRGQLTPGTSGSVWRLGFGCHNWGAPGIHWEEARDAAQHPAICRAASPQQQPFFLSWPPWAAQEGTGREGVHRTGRAAACLLSVGHLVLTHPHPLCLLQNPDNQIVQTSKEMRTSNHCPTVSAPCPPA